MDALLTYVLRQGDRALVLAQRLLEQVTHAPEIEEDMALANLALDLIGQARALYTYAGEIEGEGHDEDHFAYWRDQHEFLNPLLVEQPNGDFAHVIVRQFLHDAFALPYWQAMTRSSDATLAALAGKSEKETAYHLRHSRAWVVRLGDGTDGEPRPGAGRGRRAVALHGRAVRARPRRGRTGRCRRRRRSRRARRGVAIGSSSRRWRRRRWRARLRS